MSKFSIFRLDEKLSLTVNELKIKSNAGSNAEVVRRAITLLKLAHKASMNGEKVLLVKPGEAGKSLVEREIIIC